MNEVRLSSVQFPKPNVLEVRLARRGPLARAIGPRFWCEYDVPIHTIPESIAVIPVLGTVLPIAWALDGDVHLPTADATLLGCLDELKQAHGALYPSVRFGGRLHVDKVAEGSVARADVESEEAGEAGNVLLFSGGVDSVSSFLQKRDAPTRLVSMWGADIRLWDRRNWEVASAGLKEVAGQFGVPWHYVRSNFREFVRYGNLNRRFRTELGNWWTAVQHGFGLLSLCAPLAAATGSRRVLIPATHKADVERSLGSHPSLDNKIRWTGVQCEHDGSDLSRVEKIQRIADSRPAVPVRVCYGNHHGGNCGVCEKCARTVMGFLAVNADPNEHGFDIGEEDLDRMRRHLEDGRYRLTTGRLIQWEDIAQHAAKRDRDGKRAADELMSWFAGADLQRLLDVSQARNRGLTSLSNAAETLLPFSLFYRAKKVYYRLLQY